MTLAWTWDSSGSWAGGTVNGRVRSAERYPELSPRSGQQPSVQKRGQSRRATCLWMVLGSVGGPENCDQVAMLHTPKVGTSAE